MSTRPRRRRRLKSITAEERLVVGLASALAAIGALAAGAHPTPHLVSDVMLTAGFAVVLTLAASVARTWAWVMLASTAAVATGGEYPIAAIAVELYALIATVVDVPLRRMFGAFVGASAV